MSRLTELDARLQENILKQARIQAQQERLLQSLAATRKLTMVTIPGLAQTGELLARAIFAIRKGLVSVDSFIAELKAANIIGKTGLSADDAVLVKDAFNKARTFAKDEKLVADIEKAIKEGDMVRLKGIADLSEASFKNRNIALDISERVKQSGKFRKSGTYHGDTMHSFQDSTVKDIIANPEAIFETANGQRLIYYKNGNVAIVEATGSARGNVITAYGKSGTKGQSGANALGGLPTDPGQPITIEMITNGNIPSNNGFFEPATKLYP
ncbi:MAG: hypothetical protein ACRCYO_08025 [Bacteroidia bacterium]